MSEEGALVGIGVNQVRVFRDGYTPVVENVTTDSDLTKTYRLVPSPADQEPTRSHPPAWL
jgi:hypothetical protein